MSSSASRQRQRQRRQARQRLWDAQKTLAERQVDLVSYERVIIDMTTKRQLAPFGGDHAIELVTICRNVTRDDCARLCKAVEDLERAAEDLEPKQEASP